MLEIRPVKLNIKDTRAYSAAADELLAGFEAIAAAGVSAIARDPEALKKRLARTSALFELRRDRPGLKITRDIFFKLIMLRTEAARLMSVAEDLDVRVPGHVGLSIMHFPDFVDCSKWEAAKDALSSSFRPSLRLLRKIRNESEIRRFEKHRAGCVAAFGKFELSEVSGLLDHAGADWSEWCPKLERRFSAGIPIGFQSDPLLSAMMVLRGHPFSYLRETLHLEAKYSKRDLKWWLRESCLGEPEIVCPEYLTSHNSVRCLYHLSRFSDATGTGFSKIDSVVEWGGGFGNMARVFRRVRPRSTYVMIDLPAMCGLQAAYLTGVFGGSQVHLVNTRAGGIRKGKINIVPLHLVRKVLGELRPDLFISTYALSETAPAGQRFVDDCDFFGARGVLLSFYGHVARQAKLLPTVRSMRVEPTRLDPGTTHHYYAFRWR